MKRYCIKNNDYKDIKNLIYIGRSCYNFKDNGYGNPYKLSEYKLNDCLKLYKDYLYNKYEIDINFRNKFNNDFFINDNNILCFCSLNSKCHGDIIIEFVNLLKKDEVYFINY